MDGFKKRLTDSLQFKISFSIAICILGFALTAGIVAFKSAYDEAHELQDDVLRQVSSFITQQPLSLDVLSNGGYDKGGDAGSHIIIQQLSNAPGSLNISASMLDGLQSFPIDGKEYRSIVKTMHDGERIAISQPISFRDEIARDSALRTVMPLLLLLPALLFIVAYLVQKIFQPIKKLSRDIDHCSEQDLHSIEEINLPSELRPFLVAINRLLERVNQSVVLQRRFIADAAHEMRSPLTALSLQAERIAQVQMSPEAQERIGVLRQGINRNRDLLEQLLSLAKAQSPIISPENPTSIQEVFRSVLGDLLPLAEAKHLDIGVEEQEDVSVFVSVLDLTTIVKNLVANAIRYTPDHGRIDLDVHQNDGHVIINVRDNGPGIPIQERDRVFEPFYRTLGTNQSGSGLGLAIVKAIAEKIGAEIRLEFSDETNQSGMLVSVLLPAEL
jgi:two-component system, OmpR family, sensor kinase